MSNAVTVSPILLDVAEWVIEVYFLPEQSVGNVWMKKVDASFTDGREVKDRNRGVHICDDKIFYDDANLDSDVVQDVNFNVFEGEV